MDALARVANETTSWQQTSKTCVSMSRSVSRPNAARSQGGAGQASHDHTPTNTPSDSHASGRSIRGRCARTGPIAGLRILANGLSKIATRVGCHNTVTRFDERPLDAPAGPWQLGPELATAVCVVRDSLPAGPRSQQETRDATNPSHFHRLTTLLGAPVSGARHPASTCVVVSCE